jgi:hypothetical protein
MQLSLLAEAVVIIGVTMMTRGSVSTAPRLTSNLPQTKKPHKVLTLWWHASEGTHSLERTKPRPNLLLVRDATPQHALHGDVLFCNYSSLLDPHVHSCQFQHPGLPVGLALLHCNSDVQVATLLTRYGCYVNVLLFNSDCLLTARHPAGANNHVSDTGWYQGGTAELASKEPAVIVHIAGRFWHF